MDVSGLIDALNPAQRDAVCAEPGPYLVLAGAGSGKTRVLTHRIGWLIAVEGVSPHSILAVTFTNKAAAEMRGRIEQLVNVPVRTMWVGTFHGIAHRLLRLHWKEAGLAQNFQILDADDQQRLVKRVIRALDLSEEQWVPKQVTGWINAQKEEGRRPSGLEDQGDFAQRQLVRIYSAYEAQCAQNGLVDFAELLLRAHELCRDVPLQWPLDDLGLSPPDGKTLVAFLKAMEFTTITKRAGDVFGEVPLFDNQSRAATATAVPTPAMRSRRSPAVASATTNIPASAASDPIAMGAMVPACTSGNQNG